MIRNAFVLSVFAVGTVFFASTALAKSQPVIVTAHNIDVPQERVTYRDLNLMTHEGIGILRARITRASVNVCVGTDFTPQEPVVQSCAKHASQNAEPQMQTAIERAREIALTGHSSIAAAAITIAVPRL